MPEPAGGRQHGRGRGHEDHFAIAAAAVGSAGQEATITSMGFRYSIILLLMMCGWVYLLSLLVGG